MYDDPELSADELAASGLSQSTGDVVFGGRDITSDVMTGLNGLLYGLSWTVSSMPEMFGAKVAPNWARMGDPSSTAASGYTASPATAELAQAKDGEKIDFSNSTQRTEKKSDSFWDRMKEGVEKLGVYFEKNPSVAKAAATGATLLAGGLAGINERSKNEIIREHYAKADSTAQQRVDLESAKQQNSATSGRNLKVRGLIGQQMQFVDLPEERRRRRDLIAGAQP